MIGNSQKLKVTVKVILHSCPLGRIGVCPRYFLSFQTILNAGNSEITSFWNIQASVSATNNHCHVQCHLNSLSSSFQWLSLNVSGSSWPCLCLNGLSCSWKGVSLKCPEGRMKTSPWFLFSWFFNLLFFCHLGTSVRAKWTNFLLPPLRSLPQSEMPGHSSEGSSLLQFQTWRKVNIF